MHEKWNASKPRLGGIDDRSVVTVELTKRVEMQNGMYVAVCKGNLLSNTISMEMVIAGSP